MKRVFLSFCLIVPMMWGVTHLHADDAIAFEDVVTIENDVPSTQEKAEPVLAQEATQGLWEEQEGEGFGIEQEAAIPKSPPMVFYPLIYQEIQEMFYGSRIEQVCGVPARLEEAAHLRFVDGSLWQVSHEDRYKLDKWRPGHLIAVQPNHDWLSQKSFPNVIHNLNTQERVAVIMKNYCDINMRTMPKLERLNTSERIIRLEHGTRWYIPFEELRKISKWQEGDIIMIGQDQDWWSGSFNCLLNLNKQESCQAIWQR